MNMERLGWNSFFHACFKEYESLGYEAARIAGQERNRYAVCTKTGTLPAHCSGRLRHTTVWQSDLPCVGDWVAVTCSVDRAGATIHHVLPRMTAITRKCAGMETRNQVLSSNIDCVLLMSGLDGEFNVRRIERYLLVARESGAAPVIVLNKSDVCNNLQDRIVEVENVAGDVPIHAISVLSKHGLDRIMPYLSQGRTAAVLGSSGVGKSSLVNHLLGEARQSVAGVRLSDSRGRHTTTSRELIMLPGGGLIIDTPGLRELQLWNGDDQLDATFEDIEGLAVHCRFTDCSHDGEPNCAVVQAVESGAIPPERLRNYRRFRAELRYVQRRRRERIALEERAGSRRGQRLSRRRSNRHRFDE